MLKDEQECVLVAVADLAPAFDPFGGGFAWLVVPTVGHDVVPEVHGGSGCMGLLRTRSSRCGRTIFIGGLYNESILGLIEARPLLPAWQTGQLLSPSHLQNPLPEVKQAGKT